MDASSEGERWSRETQRERRRKTRVVRDAFNTHRLGPAVERARRRLRGHRTGQDRQAVQRGPGDGRPHPVVDLGGLHEREGSLAAHLLQLERRHDVVDAQPSRRGHECRGRGRHVGREVEVLLDGRPGASHQTARLRAQAQARLFLHGPGENRPGRRHGHLHGALQPHGKLGHLLLSVAPRLHAGRRGLLPGEALCLFPLLALPFPPRELLLSRTLLGLAPFLLDPTCLRQRLLLLAQALLVLFVELTLRLLVLLLGRLELLWWDERAGERVNE